ncbi:MAG: iron ABC transporter substrate-binding protein [Candidatus Hydrothermarchaeaceae archaeon]
MNITRRKFVKYAGAAALAFAMPGCLQKETQAKQKELTVYSGRGENLISPLIERLQVDTGINVKVRYGNTAGLASTILEEGKNSPADLFFAQDAGALGALAKEGRLLKLPNTLLERVDHRFRSFNDDWIGITGRARTVDYNTELLNPSELPDSIWGYTDTKWGDGKIGWAPTNGSFQSFVTAFRVLEGEEKAQEWLEGIIANEPQVYPKNTPIVAALGRGEIYVGFVNNYYLHRFKAEDTNFPVEHSYTQGDAGSMINVAGVGIVDTVKDRSLAEQFISHMLKEETQRYYTNTTYEYPLVKGVEVIGNQKPLSEIDTPDIDLSDIDDLNGTLTLLQDVGAL